MRRLGILALAVAAACALPLAGCLDIRDKDGMINTQPPIKAGKDAEDLGSRLRQAGVNVHVSLMGEGPHNAPEAGATPVLRISPHYYNTSEEIDRAVAILGEIIASRAGRPGAPLREGSGPIRRDRETSGHIVEA